MWCFLFVVLCFSSFVKCQDDVSVTVNCNPIENSKRNYSSVTGDIYSINHEYHDNEWVFIKCEKTTSSRIISDSIEYIGSELHIQAQMQKDRHTYLYIKLTEKTDSKYVDCMGTIQNQNQVLPRQTRIYFKRSYDLTQKSGCDNDFVRRFEEKYFTSKEDEEDSYKRNSAFFLGNFPLIKGLSHDNMLAVFFQNYKTLEIVYKYNKIGEKFDLTCIADNPTWVYIGYFSKLPGINENSASFTINNKTMSHVTCKSGEYSTTIKFYFEEVKRTPKTIEQVSSPAPNTIETGEEATEDQTKQGGMKKAEKTTNILQGGSSYLIIGGGVTISVLLLVVLFVCFIKIFRKKPVTPNPEVNRSYETLTERNKDMSTMPSQRQYPEVQYCVPEDSVTNNDYAVPHQPTVEEMYSRPIPKNARENANDNFGYESVDNRIATKPIGNSTLNKVLPTKRNNNPYATVRFNDDCSETASESPYAEVNFEEANVKPLPGYTNVFEGQRYVNSNSNKADYAEPAYCEPNKFSK